jgi:hypothetical protein
MRNIKLAVAVLGLSIIAFGSSYIPLYPLNEYAAASRSLEMQDDTAIQFTSPVRLPTTEGEANDNFGWDVGLSGETAVVGAPFADVSGRQDQGAAYVFIRSNGNWLQQAKLVSSDGVANDQFGFSVAVYENTIVVGSRRSDPGGIGDSGAVYVFVRSGTIWSQQQKLIASDGMSDDRLGAEVALHGDTLVAGASTHNAGGGDNTGAAYVFVRANGTWSQQAKLAASIPVPFEFFGSALDIQGNAIVVGAPDSSNVKPTIDTGSAYVFSRSGTVWTQEARLLPNDGADNDNFGGSVSIHGNTVAVGSIAAKLPGGGNQGAVYVFVGSGAGWTQQAKLVASDAVASHLFGRSLNLREDTLVVSASENSSGGALYLFSRSAVNWTQQQKANAVDGAAGDQFGFSLDATEQIILTGAPTSDIEGKTDQGSAYSLLIDCEAALNCPSNVHVYIGSPSCPESAEAPSAVVNYPTGGIVAGCTFDATCVPPSGGFFPTGVTEVTCRAGEGSSQATCSFTVTAYDILIQDSANPANSLRLASRGEGKGSFQLCCNGQTLTGKGKVKRKRQGCKIIFTFSSASVSISASVKGFPKGSVDVESAAGAVLCSFKDSDVRNNQPTACP